MRNMTSYRAFSRGLENKVALITGATSGIGRATAVAFAKAGVKVVIGDIRERPVGDGVPTADIVRDIGGRVLFVGTDVAQKSQVEALVRRAVQEFGRVDILVNNAGVGHVSSVEHTPTDLALEVTPDAAMSTKTVRSLNRQEAEHYGSPPRRLQSPEEVAHAVLASALRPRGAIYLSRRIRFHGLFRYLLPSAVDREARRMKASLQKLLEKVARGDVKTEKTYVRQNFRITR